MLPACLTMCPDGTQGYAHVFIPAVYSTEWCVTCKLFQFYRINSLTHFKMHLTIKTDTYFAEKKHLRGCSTVYDGTGNKPEWMRIVMKCTIRRKGAGTNRVKRKNCILCVLDRASPWYLNKGWPTRWHLLYYLLLNMFQTLIRPSSGAIDYLLRCVGWREVCWCYVAGLSVGEVLSECRLNHSDTTSPTDNPAT